MLLEALVCLALFSLILSLLLTLKFPTFPLTTSIQKVQSRTMHTSMLTSNSIVLEAKIEVIQNEKERYFYLKEVK